MCTLRSMFNQPFHERLACLVIPSAIAFSSGQPPPAYISWSKPQLGSGFASASSHPMFFACRNIAYCDLQCCPLDTTVVLRNTSPVILPGERPSLFETQRIKTSRLLNAPLFIVKKSIPPRWKKFPQRSHFESPALPCPVSIPDFPPYFSNPYQPQP
jgi:hypothetical protein